MKRETAEPQSNGIHIFPLISFMVHEDSNFFSCHPKKKKKRKDNWIAVFSTIQIIKAALLSQF